MTDVWYVPGVTKNLLSVGKMADLGYGIYFNSHKVYIFCKPPSIKKLLIITRGTRDHRNGLNRMDQFRPPEANLVITAPSSDVWHARLGHLNIHGIELMSRRQVATGIPSNLTYSSDHMCDIYQYGRQTRERAPHSTAT